MTRLALLTIICFGLTTYPSAGESRAAETTQPKSPRALQTEIDALKVNKVAWREIQWRICLLDGLQASKKEHKPLMLWIFIDRPIDDERC